MKNYNFTICKTIGKYCEDIVRSLNSFDGEAFNEENFYDRLQDKVTDYAFHLSQQDQNEIVSHYGLNKAYKEYQASYGKYKGDDLEGTLASFLLYKELDTDFETVWKPFLFNNDKEIAFQYAVCNC